MKNMGFSLIEVMVSISIMSFLLVLSAPAFISWTANMQLKNAAQALNYAIKQTKLEAIKTNSRVRLEINGPSDWVILQENNNRIINVKNVVDGFNTVVLDTVPNNSNQITFNGVGARVLNSNGTQGINRLIISSNLVYDGEQRLRIGISDMGVITTCNELININTHHMFCEN